jgi:para-aminobenzoate synthetase / 4-amino-4-deoxychorismate lyase
MPDLLVGLRQIYGSGSNAWRARPIVARLEATSAIQSPRPNPRAGVFETILVFEDRPIELAAHLRRLERSVGAVYGQAPPAGLRDQVMASSRGGWLGRLRLTVEPDLSGELHSSIVIAPMDPNNVFPTGPFATALRSFPVDRGYGEHKWADREMLARAEASAGPGAAPLLVRADGEVLEVSRSNVFAVIERTIVTPPLDGEILPGVARGGAIEVAGELGFDLRERRLGLEELKAADEAFLTNALRGVEPVREVDGVEVAADGPITTAVAAGLRQRWFAGAP